MSPRCARRRSALCEIAALASLTFAAAACHGTIRDGYTDQEIATAKDSWLQARQVGRSQDGALTGALLNHTHNSRTMAWDAELESKVRALTPEQIRAAMQKYLDPAKMTYMRGGDFTKAAKQ